jgi:GT2 family glycosyltransferase
MTSARGPTSAGPIDVIMLSHDRLEFLQAAVDALYARTPEPFRLTIVDNASGPNVRNWLAENEDRFERVIRRPVNEHVSAFQHGIEFAKSDPFVITDPDLIVPDTRPSWLAELLGLLGRHPDFGLLGLLHAPPEGVPPGATHEPDPQLLVDGEIEERNVGTIFQLIRRDALREPYVKDSAACNAVRAAGYRVGRATKIRAVHLGDADHRRFPAHLAEKNKVVSTLVREKRLSPYPFYAVADGILPRPPSFEEVAQAAPILAAVRSVGVPDAAILEVAWAEQPLLAAVLEAPVAISGATSPLPPSLAAGGIVLLDPPASRIDALLRDAFRVASTAVVLRCTLETVGGRSSTELAAASWSGSERHDVGRVQLELARCGDRLRLDGRDRYSTIEERERWLEFFAAGAFGAADRRLFVFTRDEPGPVIPVVRGAEGLELLRASSREFAQAKPRREVSSLLDRLRRRRG